MAGFNVYDIGNDGRIDDVSSQRLELAGQTFREVRVPKPS